jgi:hypothetical protein
MRSADQKALHLLARFAGEECELILGLDPFRNDRQIQAAAQTNDCDAGLRLFVSNVPYIRGRRCPLRVTGSECTATAVEAHAFAAIEGAVVALLIIERSSCGQVLRATHESAEQFELRQATKAAFLRRRTDAPLRVTAIRSLLSGGHAN